MAKSYRFCQAFRHELVHLSVTAQVAKQAKQVFRG